MTKKKQVSTAKTKRSEKKRGPGRPPSEVMTITQLAEAAEVSRSFLNTAIETGRLPSDCFKTDHRGHRVLVEPQRALNVLRDLTALRGVDSLESPLPEGVDFDDPDTWPRDGDGLRVVREWWIARHAKRKDDLAAGELVRAEDIRRELFGAMRVIRDQLLKIPDGAAADVAAELGVDDVEAVRKLLRKSIERALSDLSAALQSVANSATGDEAAE
jgi:antitoxin component of RelBE/YafQ-DinJ toxin-antitoxin module